MSLSEQARATAIAALEDRAEAIEYSLGLSQSQEETLVEKLVIIRAQIANEQQQIRQLRQAITWYTEAGVDKA